MAQGRRRVATVQLRACADIARNSRTMGEHVHRRRAVDGTLHT
ncbi:MAG: hypothetical protein PVH68_07135 [Armatimonadota bacterium]|jgi:hypothetical protein